MASSLLYSASVQTTLPPSHHLTSAPSAASSSLLPPACSFHSSLSCTFLSKQPSSSRQGGRRTSCQPLHVAAIAAGPPKSPAETEWKTKREALLRNKVRSVSAKEALNLVKEQGYIIVDVRPEAEFAESHPEGAVNVQVYRLIKEWTAWDIARRAAFAFFGIFQGTEENPEFLKEVGSNFSRDSRLIVACGMGGTTKATQAFSSGKESRSLIAAYLLTLEGYKNILHMEGGLRSWFQEDLPIFSKEDS